MASLNVSDLNRQGKVFVTANVSAKTMSAVSTTATGIMVYNPPASGVKALIVDTGFSWTTVPGALHNIGLAMMSYNTALPTALTVAGRSAVSADGAGNIPKCIGWDAATLPVAPVAVRWFAGAAWITGGSGEAPYQISERVDGSLILVPGSLIQITCVGTAPVGMGHFTWVEVPA